MAVNVRTRRRSTDNVVIFLVGKANADFGDSAVSIRRVTSRIDKTT